MWPYLDKVRMWKTLACFYVNFSSECKSFCFGPLLIRALLQAICRTAKEIAKPIIAENTVKYKIESVEFETLTLGSLPPTFQG